MVFRYINLTLKLIFLTIQIFINLSNSGMTIKMKSKSSLLLTLSFFALFFLAGFASCSITLYPNSYSATIQQGSSGSFTFKIYNGGICSVGGVDQNCTVVNLTSSVSNLTGTAGIMQNSGVIIGTLPVSIANQTNSSDISVTINIPSSQATGAYAGNITINGKNNESGGSISDELSLSITVTEATVVEPEDITKCKTTGDNGNLNIDIDDVSVENGFGDDWEWFPLDEISIDVSVENVGGEDIKNIVLGWGLYDKKTDKWILDGEENDFKLKDGDDKTVTISFKLDKRVNKLNDEDYAFYVWATGEDEEFDGNKTCVYDSESVDMIIESDFVILDSIQLIGTTSCGSTVQVTANVWNVGEDDQNEVSIYLYDKGKLLSILKDLEVGDIDSFDKQELSFEFQIPQTAENGKWYDLIFQVFDENEDLYQNDYDDDYAEFHVPFKVEGNCVLIPKVSISASLASEAVAGQPVTIKALIKNTDAVSKVYSINAAAYTAWASNAQIDKTTFTLGAGESTEIAFTFDVLKGVSGSQLFNIEITSNGKLEITQPVQVEIAKEPTFWDKITSKATLGEEGGDVYLWALGALNVVLIVLIIIVAVKASKK